MGLCSVVSDWSVLVVRVGGDDCVTESLSWVCAPCAAADADATRLRQADSWSERHRQNATTDSWSVTATLLSHISNI